MSDSGNAERDPAVQVREGTIDVFVADDEEAVVDVLQAVIATDPSLRYVGSANDADAAIAGVAIARPDVALVDVRMPGGGGIHAAREIRRRELPTKIVALSAHEDADTIIAMVGVGADAYVAKADPTERIVRAIHRVVDREWREDEDRPAPRLLAPPLPQRKERAPRVARAILEGAVMSSFEPIVDLATREIVGVDARPHVRAFPERAYDGWLADAAAEDLLADFELTAFRSVLPVIEALPPDIFVEFQMTATTAANPRFRRAVAPLGRRIVLGFSALEVLSEEARDGLADAAAEFRLRGIGISARDVGPGIEGLRQLARLSPDHAWLDPTFTRGLGESFTIHSVAATVVACAEEAGASVIADDVTTTAQLDQLLALRVAMAAGPVFMAPGRRSEQEGTSALPSERGSRPARADADGSSGGPGGEGTDPRAPRGGRH